MKHLILSVNTESQKAEVLGSVETPEQLARASALIKAMVVSANPVHTLPTSVKRRAKPTLILRLEEGSEAGHLVKPGDLFDTAADLARALQVEPTAVVQALYNARKNKSETEATVKGVTFCYGEDAPGFTTS